THAIPTPVPGAPPLRPSTRSISTSMASVPPPPVLDLGEGTPGPAESPLFERSMTVSVVEAHPRFIAADTRTTSVSHSAWSGSERTSQGVGKLNGRLDACD